MDLRRVRHAPGGALQWPGRAGLTVWARALSRAELDRAELAAEAVFAAEGLDARGAEYDALVAAETLATALGVEVWGLARAATGAELAELFARWEAEVQAPTLPDLDQLREELRKRVCDDLGVFLDGLRAQHLGLEYFYGAGPGELTDGQLFYYLLVRSAWDEMHPRDGRRKLVSKEWLSQGD